MSFRSAPVPEASVSATESSPRPYSLIDQHSTVDGTLRTSQNLRVDGFVQGSVECDGVVYIAEGAEIDAAVSATDVVIAGTLKGTVHCRGRLEIRATGVVQGKVETQRLVIHEGGVYEGRLTMTPAGADERLVEDQQEAETPPSDTPGAPSAAAGPPRGGYSFLRSPSTRTDQDDLPASSREDEEPEE